ncbi:MAG: DUF4870 domain-containing protein [Acidobacteriota bacterium]|jgi:uncharacterized Tic20 family protein
MTETNISRDARRWAMLAHLTALAGLLGNGIGFLIGPLVVWLVKREDDPFIDQQGKEAVNFQLTMFLALFLSVPLVFLVVGIPIMIAIGLLMCVLPVFAAIRAQEGVAYRYPLTLRFLK